MTAVALRLGEPPPSERSALAAIAREVGSGAVLALREELAARPKPGLVSPGDPGAHGDMDASTFVASIRAIEGYFVEAARAGATGSPFGELRALAIGAEARMLRATGGANTHRGAIFTLGILAAAAAGLAADGEPPRPARLRDAVRSRFGRALREMEPATGSHGSAVARRHGVPGARAEAASGFPHVFEVGLPALEGSLARDAPREAAALQCLMSLVAVLPDTNLLHRGGAPGLRFARESARGFLAAGGVHREGWERELRSVHAAFVRRNLSPGGSADLLAASLFARRLARSGAG